MNYKSISNVIPSSIRRFSTSQEELDWMYGFSEFSDGSIQWGMPIGKLSTWAGQGGVGKSRLAITLSRLKVQQGSTILYLQSEVDLPTLAQWVGVGDHDYDLKNFYCSDATSLKEQTDIIREIKPELVFVDSVNKIQEFGTGSDRNIKKIVDAYRDAIKETGSHVVFLCQIVKDGSTKGSTALVHDPDCVFYLTNDKKGGFRISVGNKHRYGRTGAEFFGNWKHTESGVECISNNRFKDEKFSRKVVANTPIRISPPPPSPGEPDVGPMPGVPEDMDNWVYSFLPSDGGIAPNEDNDSSNIELFPITDPDIEYNLTQATHDQRDKWFEMHPHQEEYFYNRHPGLRYGSFGIVGKLTRKMLRNFKEK